MPDDALPGPTPTGYQRTQGGGFRWQPPAPEHLAKLLPQYEIEALIGRGGMGAVYKGKQRALDRPVAIKILPPEVDDEDASYTERFKNEAKIMARLEHPAIVPVYDFGETSEGQLYFVMSFINGTDVHQMIQQQGRLPPEHALAITAHVCDALKYAHEHGVIHRDIKPSNVLINMEGQVKVADFGLAKVDDPSQSSGLTKTGLAMGTPDYVAPETLTLGMTVDGRADLYAVGVMLYQMLTGNVPRGAFKPASVMIPGIDPRFDAIATKAMQHDREERYASAGELRRDLDAILTMPMVQAGGQASAAIPKQAVAQKPGAKGPQKPMGKSANVPVRQGAAGKAVAGGSDPGSPGPLDRATIAKSRTPLFIGIGAVAAIAVGAAVMMGGKKETSQAAAPSSAAASPASTAPIKVREEPKAAAAAPNSNPASSSPAPAVSPSPSLPVSASSDKFPPGQWVKVFTKFEDLPSKLREPGSGVKLEDGWVKPAPTSDLNLWCKGSLGKNQGVRATFQVASRDLKHANINLRYMDGTAYMLEVRDDERISMRFQSKVSDRYLKDIFKELTLPHETSTWPVTLELIAINNRLYARCDNKLIASVTDARLESGDINVSSGSFPVRDIEVMNLDGIPEAEALKILGVDEKGNDLRQPAVASSNLKSPISNPAASSPAPSANAPAAISNLKSPISNAAPAAFPPGQWVKLFTKFEELPEELRKPERGVSWENGWIRFQAGKPQRIYVANGLTNYAIRARLIMQAAASQHKLLFVRAGAMSSPSGYILAFGPDRLYASIRSEGTSEAETLWKALPPSIKLPEVADEYTLEWACVGTKLIGRLDNSFVKMVENDTYPSGAGYFTGGEDIRDIEVINLDGLPEAEALRILGVDEKGNDLRAALAKQEQQKAEQAKVVDALAAIPELKALHEQFVKLQAERVTAPFEADVAKLNTGYVGGLDREIVKERQKGDLDGVLVLEAEKKLIPVAGGNSVAGGSDPGTPGSMSRATTMPIPAEDDDATPANLKALRAIYRTSFAKLEATRAANLKALTDPLSVRLKQLESTLTQQNRIDPAKAVRNYRENLGTAVIAPPAANGGSNPAAGASHAPSPPDVSSSKKFVRGDDRKAAEWALNMGGIIAIREGKKFSEIRAIGDLPRGPFAVELVSFKFPDSGPPQPITDLKPLAGLSSLDHLWISGLTTLSDDMLDVLPTLPRLQYLDLTKGSLTDACLTHVAALRSLGHLNLQDEPGITGTTLPLLSSLKNLKRLSLQNTGLTADGIRALAGLRALSDLNLSATAFQDSDLPVLDGFRDLERLTVPAGVSLEALASRKNLRGLTALGFSLPDKDARVLCGRLAETCPKVTWLRIEMLGGKLTAEELGALSAFPKVSEILTFGVPGKAVAGLLQCGELEVLKFNYAPVLADADLVALSGHKKLHTLEINPAIDITDAGILTLAQIKKLKSLTLRSAPKITDAGIAAFKKQRPDVTLVR